MISGENFGFIIVKGKYATSYRISIHSSESPELSKRPTLTVIYKDSQTPITTVSQNNVSKPLSIRFIGKNRFTINGKGLGKMTAIIYSIDGKIIITKKQVILSENSNTFTMPTENLSMGNYIISIKNGVHELINQNFLIQ